jgi:hypothetical protein
MKTQAIQTALYTRLTAEQALPVYTDVPQADEPEDDSAFPYITIGNFIGGAYDDKTSVGGNLTVDVKVLHRTHSTTEVRAIADSVKPYLHRYDLPVSGCDYVNLVFEAVNDYDDPDGKTKHVVHTYRITYQEG